MLWFLENGRTDTPVYILYGSITTYTALNYWNYAFLCVKNPPYSTSVKQCLIRFARLSVESKQESTHKNQIQCRGILWKYTGKSSMLHIAEWSKVYDNISWTTLMSLRKMTLSFQWIIFISGRWNYWIGKWYPNHCWLIVSCILGTHIPALEIKTNTSSSSAQKYNL